jgi:hypothetical protein
MEGETVLDGRCAITHPARCPPMPRVTELAHHRWYHPLFDQVQRVSGVTERAGGGRLGS